MKSHNNINPEDLASYLTKNEKIFNKEDQKIFLEHSGLSESLEPEQYAKLVNFLDLSSLSLILFGYITAIEDVSNISVETAQKVFLHVLQNK